MSQLHPRKKSLLHRYEYNPSILRSLDENIQQLTKDPCIPFKKQMLSKLNLDECFQFKIEIKPNNENKSARLLEPRKRSHADIVLQKKFHLPQIEVIKKQDQFKSEFRQLKLQSRRMLDRVNQLYGIIADNIDILKNDSGHKSTSRFRSGKTLNKPENVNPQQGAMTFRRRNRTIDHCKQIKSVELQPSKIDLGRKRSARAVYTKRRYSQRRTTHTQQSPQQALMFTFYPKHQQINEFLS